jgi:very-short-patch-repair endonuclease
MWHKVKHWFHRKNYIDQKSTPQAIKLREELERRGLRVLSEVNDRGHKHVDLAIPSARINIEVDGRQHYENPFQIMSDLKRSHYSDYEGYDTIHIPNIFIDDPSDLRRVADALTEAAVMREKQLETKLQ